MSSSSESAEDLNRAPGPRRSGTSSRPRKSHSCQLPLCTAPLQGRYERRFRICSAHRVAAEVAAGDELHRYCQQCNSLHPLHRFDGSQRSCREHLARHAERRRILRRQQREERAQQAPREGSPAASRPQTSRKRQRVGPLPEQPPGQQQEEQQQQPATAPTAAPAVHQRALPQQLSAGWGSGVPIGDSSRSYSLPDSTTSGGGTLGPGLGSLGLQDPLSIQSLEPTAIPHPSLAAALAAVPQCPPEQAHGAPPQQPPREQQRQQQAAVLLPPAALQWGVGMCAADSCSSSLPLNTATPNAEATSPSCSRLGLPVQPSTESTVTQEVLQQAVAAVPAAREMQQQQQQQHAQQQQQQQVQQQQQPHLQEQEGGFGPLTVLQLSGCVSALQQILGRAALPQPVPQPVQQPVPQQTMRRDHLLNLLPHLLRGAAPWPLPPPWQSQLAPPAAPPQAPPSREQLYQQILQQVQTLTETLRQWHGQAVADPCVMRPAALPTVQPPMPQRLAGPLTSQQQAVPEQQLPDAAAALMVLMRTMPGGGSNV